GGDASIDLSQDIKNKIDNAAKNDLSNLTQAGNNVINNLAKQAITVVEGTNTHVKEKNVENGLKTFTVHADKSTTSVSSALTMTTTTNKDANDVVTTNYALDLSQATKDEIKASKTEVTGTGPIVVGEPTKGENGQNIYNVSLATSTITSTSGGSATAATPNNIATAGTVATAINALGNNTIKLGGDKQTETATQNLNKDGGIKFDVIGDSNITTKASDSKVEVMLNKDITVDSVTITNGPVINNSGIDMNEKKITDLAPGEVNATSKDAVNGSQLHSVKTEAEKHTTLSVDGGDKDTKDGETTNNLVLTETTNDKGGKHYDIKLAEKIVLGTDESKQITLDSTTGEIKAGKVTIKGEPGTINGLTNTTWNPSKPVAVSGQAATEDQLKTLTEYINTEITDYGFNVTSGKEGTGTTSGTVEEAKVSKDETVTFKAGNNLDVKQLGKEFTYSLNKDITVDSITINNGPSINSDGLNMNNKPITNVSPGKNGTDAVNKDQLDTAAKASKTEVTGTGPIVVGEPTKGENGQNIYNVSLATSTITSTSGGSATAATPNNIATAGTVATAINALGNNTIKLGGDKQTETATQNLNKDGGIKFDVIGDSNITTKASDSKVEIMLNKDITVDSVTITNGPVINNSGIDMNEKKITDLAPGEVNATSKDAVNGSQLHSVKTEAEKHTTLSVDGGDKDTKDGETTNNLVLTETTNDKGGKHYDIKLAEKIVLGTD
ncbi:hypothetical protein HP397_05870, partial [Streptobacillus felis]|nr:hypothetical protein [Streptobacillus felis]